MSILLAIDPGLRGCGVATFRNNELSWAVYVPGATGERGPHAYRETALAVFNESNRRNQLGVHELILELPRVYPGAKNKGDANDLLDLAGVDGAIAAFYYSTPLAHCFPADWKGQVPKDVMNERVKKALSADELQRIVSVGAKDHNTLDAIGIGLWRLGRLNKKVFHG